MCFRPNTDDTHQLSSVPHGIMDTSVSASGRYRSVVSVVSFLRLQFGGEERSMAKIRPGGWKSWERERYIYIYILNIYINKYIYICILYIYIYVILYNYMSTIGICIFIYMIIIYSIYMARYKKNSNPF